VAQASPPPEYLPALVTPFTQRGELSVKAHAGNVRALAEKGVEGFLLAGSTGEGPYLAPGERSRLVKAVRRRKAHLMVGVAAESTRAALGLVEEAVEAGADSILLTTPTTLARGRDDAVARFYKDIADRSKAPVLLYSVPPVTGYSLPVELIRRLSRHENVVGMKDSSGDVVRLQAIIDAAPRDFLLYSGDTKALTAAMAVGCHGAVTASGNYAAELVMTTMRVAKESPAKARRAQKRLSALSTRVEAHGAPGVKAAARAAGLDPGWPRAPLARLPKETEASIAGLIV